MSIIAAMLEGERDPWTLAALAQPEVKASPQEIAQSLEGNWRKELLFVLRQEVELGQLHEHLLVVEGLKYLRGRGTRRRRVVSESVQHSVE